MLKSVPAPRDADVAARADGQVAGDAGVAAGAKAGRDNDQTVAWPYVNFESPAPNDNSAVA